MITRQQRDLGLWACAQWRALPEEAWSFGTWHCGTHGCAIGWLDVWINGGRARVQSLGLVNSWLPFMGLASYALGVRGADFARLFVPGSTPDLPSATQVADRFEAWIREQEIAP